MFKEMLPLTVQKQKRTNFLRVVSFTLVNIYELTDRKDGVKVMQKLSCIGQHRVKPGKPWLSSSFAGFRERDVPDEKKLFMQKLITFSQVTVSPILNN